MAKIPSQQLAPFSCSYTPNVPELLTQLNCSLAVSTYQAGKVIFLSPKDEERLIQLPRTFNKAMGIALDGDKMAIACKDEVIVLKNSKDLAHHYPRKPNVYDGLYMPRLTYHTGALDVHDLDWGGDGLFAVNTSFSCLIKIDENYSFTPVWKPPFISKLASEDRCHLNGMCMENGKPKYVTAFNDGDTPQSWREVVTTGGILMDVETSEVVAANLPMPHSPRLFDGDIYVLFSATGELAKIDKNTGQVDIINKLNGFVRGLCKIGEYAFVGLSRLRKNSSTFAKLDIANRSLNAGIAIIHLPTGAFVGEIKYQMSVDEIYDVQVLPNMLRPGILNTMTEDYKLGLATPTSTYWAAINS